jgi:excisionase family DNA binding protein
MSTATMVPDMTVAEYAAQVRVSTRTVYEWVRDGKIPVRRFGKTIRVLASALDGFED